MTHSFVHYQKGGKTHWLENAWSGKEGIHTYDSLNDIKKSISSDHKSGLMGDSKTFPNLEWANFKEKDHKVGESLSDFVNIALKDN